MKSNALRFAPFAAVAITLFAMSGSARADTLPPDSCADISDVGQACTNAGTNYDQAGTCVSSTCPHSVHLADGGFDNSSSPCALCQQGATTTRPDSGTTTTPSSSSSGCSAAPSTHDDGGGFALLALAGLGLVASRKKRA